MAEWRVGRKVPINVYDGDRPVCQCHNQEDAQTIVTAAKRCVILEAALLRNRQGYVNILEMRKLDSEQWGQRDGYGGRYGALTREEIEAVIASIDAALATAPSQSTKEQS